MKDDFAQPTTLEQLPVRAIRAHALKNCLAVVDAVNMLVACELSEEAKLRLQRSKSALRRMARLIDEDLQGVPAADSCDDPAQLLSAARVLSTVRVLTQDLAEARRVHVDFRIGAGSLYGELSSLVEALGNIVKNAIESSPIDGTVVVCGSQLPDGAQLWSVRDTGPGIPGHFIQHLGVPFQSSGKPGGSGLGFAVACQTFQRHGGRVHVESAPGWGTQVSVILPRAAATQA